jgi:hypothetical protein
MRRINALAFLAGALTMGVASPVTAQQTEPKLIAVGEMAPDFALPGATRYGILENPVKLSDYRGKTVVLAFFFKVRSPG